MMNFEQSECSSNRNAKRTVFTIRIFTMEGSEKSQDGESVDPLIRGFGK